MQSPEDIELRDKLGLMVERAKDSDAGVVKAALESMRWGCVGGQQQRFARRVAHLPCCPRLRGERANSHFVCRDEIREATSSMTSVPKPLKFLRPHYEGMKEFFQDMMDSDNKILFSEVLSVLGMTMAG